MNNQAIKLEITPSLRGTKCRSNPYPIRHCGLDSQSLENNAFFVAGDSRLRGNDGEKNLRAESPKYFSVGQRPTKQNMGYHHSRYRSTEHDKN